MITLEEITKRKLDFTAHRYILPHPHLRRYIAHYTVSVYGAYKQPRALKIVPDASGCFVFSFDGVYWTSSQWGPTTRMVTVQDDGKRVPVRVFVEFLPGGAYCLTGLPQNNLLDRVFTLNQIFPDIAREIENALYSSTSIHAFLLFLDRCFLSRLSRIHNADKWDLFEQIKGIRSVMSIKDLAKETFYSERHLNRIFSSVCGMNVKKFYRLIRINQVIKSINRELDSLTGLAQKHGYFDQSHFIHDFTSICQVSPGRYMQNMSDFYNENYKF